MFISISSNIIGLLFRLSKASAASKQPLFTDKCKGAHDSLFFIFRSAPFLANISRISLLLLAFLENTFINRWSGESPVLPS